MKYSRVYRFRLTPDEDHRLAEQAREAGVSKADLIRGALGWETNAAPSLTPGGGTQALLDAAPDTATVDPEKEPGMASIAELGERTRQRLAA